MKTIQSHIQNLENYKKKLLVENAIHAFLSSNGYLQIDLPVLSPALIPEGYLEVFETEFRYMEEKEKLFLTPSPELFLKRLLVDGVGDCYYLGKSYRNSEPNSPKHFSEFTMLEFYKVGATYKDLAKVVLNLLQSIAKKVSGKSEIVYNGNTVSLEKWEEFTIAQVFEKYAQIKSDDLFNHDAFLAAAKKKGYVVEGFSYEDLFTQMYAQEIEPHLGRNGYPTILYDYPVEFASLAKPNLDGRTAQRFEFYIEGVELGNCYSELSDWSEQKRRFDVEEKNREQSGKIKHPSDWGFIDALKIGLPDCAGIAIGVERIAMIFTNTDSIDKLKLITVD